METIAVDSAFTVYHRATRGATNFQTTIRYDTIDDLH